jgi:hypothetical protein
MTPTLWKSDPESSRSTQAVDVRVGRDEVRRGGLSDRLVPAAVAVGEDLDAGLLEDRLGAGPAGVGGRVAGGTLDRDDRGTLADVLREPLGADPAELLLGDTDVDDVRVVDGLVDGEDQDVLGHGLLEHGVERRGRVRVDDDRVDVLVDQVTNLLDLAVDVGVGVLDDEVVEDTLILVLTERLFDGGDHLGAVLAADEGVRHADGEGAFATFAAVV